MRNLDASALVSNAYVAYGKHVNGLRAIPDSRDGLKLVQRRILSTLLLRGGASETPCPAVIGRCQEFYHPHGELSIYDALVGMCNDRHNLIIGEGNFGKKTFLGQLPAAAMRYTSVSLNESTIAESKGLIGFADFYTNENDHAEPVAIPSVYPYALLNGTSGIGVGIATNIPPFNAAELKRAATALLKGQAFDDIIHPESLGGGQIEIDEENLLALNRSGRGFGYACARYEWTHDDASDQRVIKITDVPDYVNLSKLNVLLKTHIADGAVYVRDDTQKGSSGLEIVVGRTKRVKRISDDEIEKVVSKVCRRKVTWNCVFARNGVAQTLTPLQVLEDALEYATKCNREWMRHEKHRLEDEIKFEKIKKELSQLLHEDAEDSEILSRLGISQDQYKLFSSRSLSRLRSAKRETVEMEARVDELDSDLLNHKRAFARRFSLQ